MDLLSSSANLKRLSFRRGVRATCNYRFSKRTAVFAGSVVVDKDELKCRSANRRTISLNISTVAQMRYRPLYGAGAD